MAMILVAEDQRELRERVRDQLGERGYDVVTAVDGLEALAALETREIDLVLSNIQMPGFDGLQVRAWKQLAPDTEVLVATEHDDIAGAIDCIRGGAFDYIERPYEIHTLVAAIERALERRQLVAASVLYETSRVILTTREPHRLPEVIVGVASKAMIADDVALLTPGDDGKLHVACSSALTESIRREVHSSLDALVQELAPTLRDPVIKQQGSVYSCILYPLCSGERLVGLLQFSRVINPRAFTKLDLDKAAVLASQTLLALENMRLVQHAISTDRLATLGQVATSIAHEINNPIAYVLASQGHLREQVNEAIVLCGRIAGGAEVLTLRARLAEMAHVLDEVRDGAERVRDILRDTRALAQGHQTPVSLDVSEPIRSALRVIAAELRHKATVTSKLTSDLFVMGHSGRLSQVIVSLLMYTIERFTENSINAIVISSKLVGGHVVLTLRDNGPGLTSDQLPRLFDPFFTTNLAIARDAVRNHGGEISVESSLELGTTYTIVLPHAAPPRARARTDSPVAVQGARLRILLIDDEPNILRAYRRALGAAHDVVLAQHGEEALDAIRNQADFDLVICDVSMPTMSGMQLFERVRERVPALAERFVFATGGSTQKSIEQFLASIPNLVLEKPFDMRVLRELVADLQRAS